VQRGEGLLPLGVEIEFLVLHQMTVFIVSHCKVEGFELIFLDSYMQGSQTVIIDKINIYSFDYKSAT
jgi:hypothetical protein